MVLGLAHEGGSSFLLFKGGSMVLFGMRVVGCISSQQVCGSIDYPAARYADSETSINAAAPALRPIGAHIKKGLPLEPS